MMAESATPPARDDRDTVRNAPGEPASGANSLLRRWPAFVLLVIAFTDLSRAVDFDLPGHIWFGHQVLRLGYLPRHDIYSYSAAGHLWRNHEWLAEVVMGLIYDAFGIPGLKLMKLVLTAATIVLIAAAEAQTGAPMPVQAVVLFAAGITLIPFMQFRPQLFTFVSLAALLVLVVRDHYQHQRPARLWLAVPLLALWANLHGGFFVGIVVLATYSAVSIVRDRAHRDRSRTAALMLLTAAAMLATLANPYGPRLWLAIARALANPLTRTFVADWRPLWDRLAIAWRVGHTWRLLLYCACLLAMFAGVGYSLIDGFRARDLPLLAIAALLGIAALISARNVPLFAIVAAAPLAAHARSLAPIREIPRDRGLTARSANRLLRLLPSAAMLAAAFALAIDTGLFSPKLGGILLPVGAVDFMQSNGLAGNVLCDFGWGEYLIWRMGPSSKVFIDGRYDTVYPDGVLRDYADFYLGSARGAEVLKAWPHDFVLVPENSSEAGLTLRSKDWKLIYADEVSVLFIRAASPAAASFYIPVRGPAPSMLFP